MNYEEFKIEDFLYDEFFVRWVRNPGPESSHFWENWIKNHPEKIKAIQKASELILSLKYKNIHEPSDQDYTAVLEKVLKQQSSWSQNSMGASKNSFTYYLKYAAAIVTISLISGAVLFFLSTSSRNEISPVSTIIKETPLGQKLTFELSDGTLVKLNAGSKLRFSETFDANERKVYLEGEAFFNVKRDELRPFIVETAQLTTTVLGTSFNVEAYGDGASTVAVLTGKVQVKKSNAAQDTDTFYLTNNQMVTISSESNSISKFDNISTDIFDWKDNIISFKKSDFSQIVSRLERWYGVKFDIQKQGHFDGLFTAKYEDVPLEIVLEGLKDEYDFQFTIDDKEVVIF